MSVSQIIQPAYCRAIEKFNTSSMTNMALIIFVMEVELGRLPTSHDLVTDKGLASFSEHVNTIISPHKCLFISIMEKNITELKEVCKYRCSYMTNAVEYANTMLK